LKELSKLKQTSNLEIVLSITNSPVRIDINPTCEFWTTDELVYSKLEKVKNQKVLLDYLSHWFKEYSEGLKTGKCTFFINMYDD